MVAALLPGDCGNIFILIEELPSFAGYAGPEIPRNADNLSSAR